ncbi:hypothetical protein HPB49_018591 [Dermacentor silvarum]|uniref:Uncharacterized protein n=1 Tax=Dermacentor silvarum TaxID=543639 RepID=A0ACB8D7J4_DERSI|nr:hypothetical protein HPB49_018591 [Dermacentor silvarum]
MGLRPLEVAHGRVIAFSGEEERLVASNSCVSKRKHHQHVPRIYIYSRISERSGTLAALLRLQNVALPHAIRTPNSIQPHRSSQSVMYDDLRDMAARALNVNTTETSPPSQSSQASVESYGSARKHRASVASVRVPMPPIRVASTLRPAPPVVRINPGERLAVVPEGYPIQQAPADNLDRLLVAVRPPSSSRRRAAPVTQRQRRTELDRIRDSFSQMWFLCVVTLAALAIPTGLVIAPLIRMRLDDALGRGGRSRPSALLWDYVPATMPLPFCQSLLYWSVAVSEGTVRDRAPDFDVNYGVWKLKNLASSISSKRPLPGLMVALGGYAEDSAHFSRLGRDTALMSRFVASVAKFLVKHDITGALVDWKGIGGHCGSRDDGKILMTLLENLRKLLRLNSAEYWVGAMLPAVKGIAESVTKAIAAVADIIVYETHEAAEYDVYEGCSKAADLTSQFMGEMSRAVTKVTPPPKQCISLSAGVWSTLAYDLNGTSVPIDGSGFYKISRRPGMAAAFECARRSPTVPWSRT